jgi:hypothetical protein
MLPVPRPSRRVSLFLALVALLLVPMAPGAGVALAQRSGPAPIDTPRVDDSLTLDQGTIVEWDSDDWEIDPERTGETAVVLVTPDDDLMSIAEQDAGRTLDETWQIRKGRTMESGGSPIDTGERPEGGWYGLWISPDTGRYVVQTVGYAPGSADVVLSVLLIASEDTIVDILQEEQAIINEMRVIWPDIDPNAIVDIFAAGRPTGVTPFISLPDETVSASSGIVDDATYVSPQFGYEITWAGGWAADEDLEISDEDEGYDSLSLSTVSPGIGGVSVMGMAWDKKTTARDVIDYWSSDAYLEDYQPEGSEVVLSDNGRRSGAVVLVAPYSERDDEEWVTVLEVAIIGSELQVNTVLAAPLDDFEDVYDDAQERIARGGDPAVGYFATDEILDALR